MERNEAIARYVGFTFEENLGWYDNDEILPQHILKSERGNCFDKLHFDKSADWTLAALSVIETRTGHGLVIYPESCYWNNFGDNVLNEEFGGESRVEMIFDAMIAFINYINE